MSPDARPEAGTASPRLRFRYGPATVDVAAAPSTLAWLEEFLAPAFEVGPPGAEPAAHEVVVEASDDAFARLSASLAAAPASRVEAWTLDGSFGTLASWRDAEGRTWAADVDYGAFLGVDPLARRVRLVTGRDGVDARLTLMRAVRELATAEALRAGRLPLHASAFRLGGGVVLAAGPKRSGKSSLLVHALDRGGAVVGNDRAFVDVDAARVEARGMPTIVMLRDGTLGLFPRLEEAFEAARFDRGRTLLECAPGVERPEPVRGQGFDRPGITTAQLARLCGAPLDPGGPVDALLFPRLEPSARGLALEPLDGASARAAAARSLLVPSRPTRAASLLAPGPRAVVVDPEVETARLARLVERVPAFACPLGPDAYGHDLRAALAEALSATGARRPPAPRRGT
jgi:hypothetical protein